MQIALPQCLSGQLMLLCAAMCRYVPLRFLCAILLTCCFRGGLGIVVPGFGGFILQLILKPYSKLFALNKHHPERPPLVSAPNYPVSRTDCFG